jgi:hypothetical protein
VIGDDYFAQENNVEDFGSLDFIPQLPDTLALIGGGGPALPGVPSDLNLGAPAMTPVALNASTTYGVDTSLENNFGLGPTYQSTATLAAQSAAIQNAPSWWWLIAIVALAWWCSR